MRGEIVVNASRARRCEQLAIAAEWDLKALDTPIHDRPRTVSLGPFTWAPGEHRHPFELPALAGPTTYRGRILSVEWRVLALAKLGWLSSARAEVPMVVEPMTEHLPEITRGGYRNQPPVVAEVAPFYGPRHVEGPRRATPLWSLLTHPLGHTKLDVVPANVRGGDQVVACFTISPPKASTVEWIDLELVGREQLGARDQRASTQHTLHHRKERVADRTLLHAKEHRFEATFEVPKDAATSFAVAYVAVEWFVVARVGLEGPDFAVEHVLTLRAG